MSWRQNEKCRMHFEKADQRAERGLLAPRHVLGPNADLRRAEDTAGTCWSEVRRSLADILAKKMLGLVGKLQTLQIDPTAVKGRKLGLTQHVVHRVGFNRGLIWACSIWGRPSMNFKNLKRIKKARL